MSHTIAKPRASSLQVDLFRRPGDLHVHFFGTATLSVTHGVKTQAGDRFEIDARPFRLRWSNRWRKPRAARLPSPFARSETAMTSRCHRRSRQDRPRPARPSIAAVEGVELTAVASRNASLDGVACFSTLDEMLGHDDLFDAVALCTPPQGRHELAHAALSAGKHVLLEKPPGATVSEVGPLEALAREKGVSLFATWHSRSRPRSSRPAHSWLRPDPLGSDRVEGGVRKWHPGQEWIWEPGGLGVFDPGINALSILTAILPRRSS